MRSLLDKMDKLGDLMRTQQEHQEGNILFFTETWLQDQLLTPLYSALSLYGQTDRCWTVGCEFLYMWSIKRVHQCYRPMVHVLPAKLLPSCKNTPTHWWWPLKISTTSYSLLHCNFLHVCQLIYILFVILFITIAYLY